MSGAGSPSCRPGSVQFLSLRQGDEEVNKRIKQKKYIYLNKLPNISV